MLELIDRVELNTVKEVFEGFPVELVTARDDDNAIEKILLYAINDSGNNGVAIDFPALLMWTRINMPDLYLSII